jgi:Flp pilus assembly CpaF family ATPase
VPPGSDVPPYTISDGVDDAMRMAPDRLIVGEVRTGTAALALFRAQMSDHPGLTTFHAESPAAAVHRLAVIMFADAQVRFAPAKSLFVQAVDVYVQLHFDAQGRRRVHGVWEIDPELQGGDVQFHPVFASDFRRVGELTTRRAHT